MVHTEKISPGYAAEPRDARRQNAQAPPKSQLQKCRGCWRECVYHSIRCDHCERGVHFACIDMTLRRAEQLTVYLCATCENDGVPAAEVKKARAEEGKPCAVVFKTMCRDHALAKREPMSKTYKKERVKARCDRCDKRCTFDVVKCDSCDVEFHFLCAGMSKEEASRIEQWHCSKCLREDQLLPIVAEESNELPTSAAVVANISAAAEAASSKRIRDHTTTGATFEADKTTTTTRLDEQATSGEATAHPAKQHGTQAVKDQNAQYEKENMTTKENRRLKEQTKPRMNRTVDEKTRRRAGADLANAAEAGMSDGNFQEDVNQQYQDGHRRCLPDFIIEADLEKKYAFVQERKDKHLGSGFHGKVRRARLVRDVAVKTINIRGKSEAQVKRYFDEAELMITAKSDFLMRCTECYLWKNGLLRIVMPLMRFGSLSTLLEKVASRRVDKATWMAVCKWIAYSIFCGLRDLHRSGRMHRDLKADNILIDHDGTVKLGDFGWSCTFGPGENHSAVAGTCHTYAPEIAENFLRERDGLEPVEYEKSIDVRSAGVVMVEIAQGYEERATASEVEMCQRIKAGDYARELRIRVEKLCADGHITDAFLELTVACLQDDPSLRLTPQDLLALPFLEKASRHALHTLIKDLMKAGARK